MIDLTSLSALRAVADCGSVVAAADALGYTPSAISQQVKRLERQTGVELLERVGRGVILTSSARQLLEAGERILADLEQIQADLHHASGQISGHVRVVAFSTAMRGIVAPAMRTLLDAHRDLTVTLSESEPWPSIDRVATGQCDVAVVHSWGDVPVEIPDHLVSETVAHDVADVIVPIGHPLAGRASVTPHDLIDERWIATPVGTICRQWLRRMHLATGRAPLIAHESLEFESHVALVEAGLGIALIPRLGRQVLPAGVAAVAATDPVPTRLVTAVARRSMAASPAISAIIEALRDAASTEFADLVESWR
ncbi:MAG TPA: LysR family transcriptional regulator [Ilumatobacter sp.]|nr:LysR family transcriptional regulator [Ilumatobacter sp.]